MIETLDGLTVGRYMVTTASGTRHLIDLEARTATRYGAAGSEWHSRSHLENVDPDIAAIRIDELTPDGEPMRFHVIKNATVGQCMYLANSDEWRRTSTVQSIQTA